MDVLQLGQDIARWSRDGKDQWRIGVMGGAGHSKTSANVRNKSAKAYGKVNGYSAGIYGTWFTHAEQKPGFICGYLVAAGLVPQYY
ncbi:autotransporter outer membrane beta-barrel domain-containing protein [Parachlamydia acanthamoebae]|uniref:autotransporter outer membrane beta-barrel domain-containing protein n=1 Tax=Parachlamydia acanthamoebae TaxID=83552 RepID=UPI00057EDB54|nr:autotransporter outer membrane beta-barrel domain-containing protein [Parachlamydia acanthamoebae]